MPAKEKKEKKKSKKEKKKKGQEPAAVEYQNPSEEEAWQRDEQGRLVTDTARGHVMLGAFQSLFSYLREEGNKSHLKDSYGLWLDMDGSDDEAEQDGLDEVGFVQFDSKMLEGQTSVKKIKHAIRVGNPELMAIEELQADLTERGLSVKGDKERLVERLEGAYEEDALRMRDTTRVVNHFTCKKTTLNIQTMVAKMNKQRHEMIQSKLQGAHEDIVSQTATLEQKQKLIGEQELQIIEDERLLAEALARIAALERLARMHENNADRLVANGKLPLGTHRMRMDGGLYNPWTLDEVQAARVDGYCDVLVIDPNGVDWKRVLRGIKAPDGRPIRVQHTAFHLMNVSATSRFGGTAVVDCLAPARDMGNAEQHTRFTPDCVLIREHCRGVHGEDHTHQLMGLLYSQVPCINAAKSVLRAVDRPGVYAVLLDLRNEMGTEKDGSFHFPLVEQDYFANEAPQSIEPRFPLVAKVSSIHAGFGRMRARDIEAYADTMSMIALHSEYCTTESLIENVECEIYIQQIGDQVKAYRKQQSATFRTWVDAKAAAYEDIPVTKIYREWITAVSAAFDGLDIFALNVLRTTDGGEYIIGLHDTACPLVPHREDEDLKQIAKLVRGKLKGAVKRKS